MSDNNTDLRPWEVGDDDARWAGYLLPGGEVLRNKIGATFGKSLRLQEDRLVEARTVALIAGEGPRIGYDLAGYQRVHHWLFQDVYDWAGELRTVDMSKAGLSFIGADEIAETFDVFTDAVLESDRLRAAPEEDWPRMMAALYMISNAIHPFREGNGRTQRLILSALAAESGHGLDWDSISGGRNDEASHRARTGDMEMLNEVIAEITYRLDENTPSTQDVHEDAPELTVDKDDVTVVTRYDQTSPTQTAQSGPSPHLL